MKIMKQLLMICGAAVLLVSCRSTRKIQTAIAKKDTVAVVAAPAPVNDSAIRVQRIFAALDSARINFRTFSAKINVDYRDASGKRYDLNTNLRMVKDSAIWLSANALLGIEALRMLVTRDSVKMLDKQNKVYTARSIDYLQEVTHLPLNLATLQDMLIGNAVFLDKNVVSFTNAANTVSVVSLGQWFKTLLTLNMPETTLQRIKLDDVDITRSRTAELGYSDYETRNGQRFATKRRINIVEKKSVDIALDFKQYTFNEEVSFPFSVPKNFRQQ